MKNKLLKDISKSISSGLTPLRSNERYWNSQDIPWVKTDQLGVKHIYDSNEKISQYALKDTSIKINPVNTISIAMYGEGQTRGRVSILKKEMSSNQACCNIVIDDKEANYEYVYYFLKSQYNRIRALASGVRKNLNSDNIKNLEILLPSKRSYQNDVAEILSEIDRKIEINKKVNFELEAMAKLIYDYWFVQFDFPDEKHKPYKSSGGEMVYNEDLKKEVPNTWSVRNISEKMQISSGYPFKSINYLDSGTYKIVTIKNVQDNRLELNNTDFVNSIPSDIDSSCILTLEDILISLTGNVGRICLVDEQNLLLNQRVGKFQTDPILKNYFYLTYQRPEFRSWLEKISSGTSQKNLSPIEAVNRLHPFPDSSTLIEFEKLVGPMIKKILLNLEENRRLETLKNWLLPMLMNGQVTVNEAN